MWKPKWAMRTGDPHLQFAVTDAKELKSLAQSQLATLKYDGYDGTLTSWLVPMADRGMTAVVIDRRYPDHETYFIRKVVITYGGKVRNES